MVSQFERTDRLLLMLAVALALYCASPYFLSVLDIAQSGKASGNGQHYAFRFIACLAAPFLISAVVTALGAVILKKPQLRKARAIAIVSIVASVVLIFKNGPTPQFFSRIKPTIEVPILPNIQVNQAELLVGNFLKIAPQSIEGKWSRSLDSSRGLSYTYVNKIEPRADVRFVFIDRNLLKKWPNEKQFSTSIVQESQKQLEKLRLKPLPANMYRSELPIPKSFIIETCGTSENGSQTLCQATYIFTKPYFGNLSVLSSGTSALNLLNRLVAEIQLLKVAQNSEVGEIGESKSQESSSLMEEF